MNQTEGYVLSQEADQDLDDIFDFTEEKYGFDQAIEYLSGLKETFKMIVKNSEIGKRREEIKVGLRGFVKSSHIIFYRIDGTFIRIVRVLHGSRDLPKWIE